MRNGIIHCEQKWLAHCKNQLAEHRTYVETRKISCEREDICSDETVVKIAIKQLKNGRVSGPEGNYQKTEQKIVQISCGHVQRVSDERLK